MMYLAAAVCQAIYRVIAYFLLAIAFVIVGVVVSLALTIRWAAVTMKKEPAPPKRVEDMTYEELKEWANGYPKPN